ncbi:hypothetical protein BHE74_00058342 [Ensete ventricosum]|nr:hypothetical protein BHE74_00058342 [Ensete ventricosum]
MGGNLGSSFGGRLLEWWSLGIGGFIVSVVGHSYMISLLSLLLTISSYLSTTPVVLATDFPRRVGHVSGPVVRGHEDVAARSTSVISLTMTSYLSTTPAVLAVRRALAGEGCRPYLCQVGCTTTDDSIPAPD